MPADGKHGAGKLLPAETSAEALNAALASRSPSRFRAIRTSRLVSPPSPLLSLGQLPPPPPPPPLSAPPPLSPLPRSHE